MGHLRDFSKVVVHSMYLTFQKLEFGMRWHCSTPVTLEFKRDVIVVLLLANSRWGGLCVNGQKYDLPIDTEQSPSSWVNMQPGYKLLFLQFQFKVPAIKLESTFRVTAWNLGHTLQTDCVTFSEYYLAIRWNSQCSVYNKCGKSSQCFTFHPEIPV